jgi:hypothetical protein
MTMRPFRSSPMAETNPFGTPSAARYVRSSPLRRRITTPSPLIQRLPSSDSNSAPM